LKIRCPQGLAGSNPAPATGSFLGPQPAPHYACLHRSSVMDRGVDFLRTQVGNAVLAHRAYVRSLEDHESQAKDDRYRDLCARALPKAIEHQRMLEDYQHALGAGEGITNKAIGLALGAARDLADVVQG